MGCRRPTGGVFKYVSSDTSHAEAFPVATPRGRSSSSHGGEHHLPLNLTKTELIVFPATPALLHDFTIQLGSSTINLGVIFDDQLTFKEHITKTAQSCRFVLLNIRKIRPLLTEHAAQLLVQALAISRLDYCNALLAGLPSSTIKPLQMIQNAAARQIYLPVKTNDKA